MGRGSENDEGVAGRATENSITRSDHVAVLGKPPSSRGTAIRSEEFSGTGKPTGVINTANVLRLLAWQGYRCALTGRPLTPDTASLDHIVPVRDGGEHTIENVQVLHKEINRAKSTLTHEQFVQMCREVVNHVASTNA
jgi:5-methylcytosine-specific restriction endonuclease McrA